MKMRSPHSEKARAAIPGLSELVRFRGLERLSDNQAATETQACLLVRQTPRKQGRRHAYVYAVEFRGELVVTGSHDPETDLARALQARGVTGFVTLIDGDSGMPRTRINIEKAAKIRTSDPDSGRLHWQKWTPHPSCVERRTAETVSPLGRRVPETSISGPWRG